MEQKAMVVKSVENIKRIDQIEKDEEVGALCKDRRSTDANFGLNQL